jgi:uncharacterized membrane protein YdfJ with MMPL/SSD domain
VGLAVAVVIDATVVRGVLLPAALAVLGERAWPRRLDRGPDRRPDRGPARPRGLAVARAD